MQRAFRVARSLVLDLDQIARERLSEVFQRIERLDALKSELERIVSECSGGRATECRIVEALSRHSGDLHRFATTRAADGGCVVWTLSRLTPTNIGAGATRRHRFQTF